MHLVILTRQIGHYHDARYRGAAEALENVTIVSTANQGGFAQFLAKETGAYEVDRLFADRQAYDHAVKTGELRPALEATLTRLKPDAIAISGWSNPESMIGIRWARANGVKLVMMSETQADDAVRSPVREWIKKHIVAACDAALVGGPTQASYINQLGIAEARTFMGYNAVDNEHFAMGAKAARSNAQELRAKYHLPERYILASCRFIEKKNLPNLTLAYGDLVTQSAEEVPDLVILGDGETKNQILAAAKQAGVDDRVHLPGYHGYEDLPALYALAELFAHVSTVEQWGLVINEAMSASTPVLASEPCGATRTLIANGKSGLVVEPTREDIARALSRFFSMSKAEQLEMAKNGANAVADWGPKKFGRGMKFAVEAASSCPPRGPLSMIDKVIFKQMERKIVESVA